MHGIDDGADVPSWRVEVVVAKRRRVRTRWFAMLAIETPAQPPGGGKPASARNRAHERDVVVHVLTLGEVEPVVDAIQ